MRRPGIRLRISGRPLPWLAAGFAIGVGAADALDAHATAGGPLALAGLAGAALTRYLGRPRAAAALLWAAFVGLGAASLGQRLAQAEAIPLAPHGCEATVDARVAEARHTARAMRVLLVGARAVEPARADCVPGRLTLSSWLDDPESSAVAALEQGDRIRARLRVAPVRGRANPGVPNPEARARRRGIGARARLVAPDLLYRAPGDASARDAPVSPLRRRVLARLRARGDGGDLVAALALGEGRLLDARHRESAARLGLAHLLAVSGLHVALVLGGAYGAMRGLLVRTGSAAHRRDLRAGAAGAALAVAAVYAGLAGGRPPVVRAWILAAFAVGGLVWGRRRARAEALAAAALVVLVRDPAALFELGPQLSFAACAALLAARPPRATPEAPWLLARIRASLGVTAAAVAATAPILAAHGLSASPWAGIANLVAVPWCAIVLMPMALATALAAGLAEMGGPLAAPLSALVAAGARVAAGHLDVVASAAAWLPTAGSARPPAPLWAVGAAGGIAVVALTCGAVAVRCALCGIVLVGLRAAPLPRIDPAPPRLVAFDVGQGDAILVQGRRGTLLVDAGGALPGRWDAGASIVTPALRALGVERIDVMAVTHADADHRGGAAAVLAAVEVGEVWVSPGFDGRARSALAARAAAAGARLRTRSAAADAYDVGDLRVRVLWPPAGPARAAPRNERSLVLAVEVAGRRLLLTGDVGRASESALLDGPAALDSDVLKVGHHGSAGGSSHRFLAAVGAEWALVSAGYPGRRGLPSPAALERLRASGARVGWTGRDGALLVGLGPELRVRAWRTGRAAQAD